MDRNVVRQGDSLHVVACAEPGAFARVRVYNSAGELVRTLFQGIVASDGMITTTWDLTNDATAPVSSNIYFLHLENTSSIAGARVGVLR